MGKGRETFFAAESFGRSVHERNILCRFSLSEGAKSRQLEPSTRLISKFLFLRTESRRLKFRYRMWTAPPKRGYNDLWGLMWIQLVYPLSSRPSIHSIKLQRRLPSSRYWLIVCLSTSQNGTNGVPSHFLARLGCKGMVKIYFGADPFGRITDIGHDSAKV